MSLSSLATILNTMADDFQVGRRGTNTITATDSITDDANLGGSDAAKELSPGSQILVTFTIDGNAPLGEITQFSTRPKLSTGLAKVDPPFTVSIVDTETFIVLFRPLRFVGNGGLIDRINEAQAQFKWVKRTLPYTLVPDGDMLASGTSDFADTNSTLAKVVAAFAKPERNISVTDSGSGGGYMAPAANLVVEPSTSYYLEVTGWGTDADDSGTLQVKDVTNSNAAITLTETVIDRMEPEILRNSFTTPSGCKEIQIRLVCDAAGDVVSWANLAFRKNAMDDYILPATPARPIDIGRLGYYQGSNWNERGEFIPVDVEPEQLSGGLWRYRTDISLSGLSLWYERFDTPADLAASSVATASTPLPARDLAAVASELVLRPLRTTSRTWAARYEYAASRAAGVIQDYHQHNQIVFKKATALYPSPVV